MYELKRLQRLKKMAAELQVEVVGEPRLLPRPKVTITTAADAFDLLHEYAYESREHFLSVTLDSASNLIAVREISVGTLNQSLVHPREVFVDAITDHAAGIIIAHNHPAQQTFPSDADRHITRRLKEAGEIIGIAVLDHIVVTKDGYYSFQEEGLL